MSVAPSRPAVLDAATADEFFDALTRADEQRAVDLAVDLVEAGVPATEVLLRLVGPAQERIGRLWQAGEWHALPARIVGDVLREHGWRVTFLGASVRSRTWSPTCTSTARTSSR